MRVRSSSTDTPFDRVGDGTATSFFSALSLQRRFDVEDGGAFVFCAASGETHRLDAVAVYVLDVLREPLTSEGIADRLAAELELPISEAMEHADVVVRRLLRAGLVIEGAA